MASSMMEARLVISADDKTGPAFAEIERKIAAIGGVSADVGRISGGIGDVSAKIGGISGAIANVGQDAGKVVKAFDDIGGSVAGAAAHVGGLSKAIEGIGSVAQSIVPVVGAAFAAITAEAVKAGAAIESSKARMGVAGITRPEIAAVEDASRGYLSKYPNIERAEVFDTYKELRSVLSNPEEVLPNLDSVVAAKSAMRAGGSGNPEDLVYAMKAAELLGKANDPAEFKKFIDASVKGQQVMGKTLRDEDVLEFAKMSKSAGLQLSDRFITTAALSLTQEMGGQQAGTALQQASKTLGGGGLANNHAAGKEWLRLGFLTDDDLDHTNNGEVKGLKAGHNLKDWRLGQTDPDLFLLQKLLPAMESAGITDPIEQNKEFERLFPGSRAANLFTHMLNQREGLANHARMYQSAAGIAGGADLLKNDPVAAATGATTASKNLFGAVAEPAMGPATVALTAFTSATAAATQALMDNAKKHPALASASGVAAAGAGALAGVAAGAGVLSLVPGVGIVSGPVAVGAGALSAGLAATAVGLRASGALYDDAISQKTFARGRYGPNGGPSGYEHDFTLGSGGGFSSSGRLRPPSNLGYMSKWDSSHVAPTPLGKEGPAIAELKGAADISLTVKIDASPELFSAIETARSISANGALRANTGTSMPEAAPTGVSGN
ncbi:hypothetical protein MPC4_80152 [Methylocella tundrae]|uniref:Uncharacterized protein n=1 Tax=Methylocella tundrae TaxID=227605 RepID=A0A8B6MCL4_METTU|nr:hypothetical protein [Methylocella tundrae]VTZ27909.1 hypothetical protein MPC1_70019 [Methylocella tundrae]VTZ52481.1 hypothetical protein MPC4_80152 [Methylocella tundrae]